MTRAMNVVGARPQFVKAGPVSRALTAAGIEETLVHTGQHYDPVMSAEIMTDVGLREPDINLGVGSGSHGVQTARMLEGLEHHIQLTKPDFVITYGDTNSTIAAALAAAKLGVLTGHIEAGLRSFNRAMPEELNRVVTDHLSNHLYAPTNQAMKNLAAEGLSMKATLTGDVMVDALNSIDLDSIVLPDWASGEFFVATVHRPSNTDDPPRLKALIEAISQLSKPVHLLAHPRLQARLREQGIDAPGGALRLHEPLSYAQMIAVVAASSRVLTDSGGLQKEAFILGVPCVTLREETEWVETLDGGWNRLAGVRLDVLDELASAMPSSPRSSPYGTGIAAQVIVDLIALAVR